MANFINEIDFDSLSSYCATHPVVLYAAPATIIIYFLARYIQKKSGLGLLNPMLVAVIVIIPIMLYFNMDYKDYAKGTSMISFMADPAIVALALPLYQKWDLVKRYAFPIVISAAASIIITFVTAAVIVLLFNLEIRFIPTLAARSITTPLAIDVSSRLGGIPPMTACIVCFVGIAGAVIGFPLLKLFHIRDKRAQGIAIGACSHAVGTAEAAQHGVTEGAFSSLGLVLCGILTTIIGKPLWDFMLMIIESL